LVATRDQNLSFLRAAAFPWPVLPSVGTMGRMSTLPAGYRVVTVPAEREDEFRVVDALAFVMESTPETLELAPIAIPWDRAVAVERGDGSFAAVHGSYPFVVPVPGGSLPASGLTWVGVRPDERRRGLLTAMVGAHFERSLARGEPVSVLFAAEHAIYGRFGYGSACDDLRLTIPRHAELRDVPGSADLTVRLATLDRELHDDLVDSIHVAVSASRPGAVTRSTAALRYRFLADPPEWREGWEAQRIVTVHDADGEPRGYALLRRKASWGPGGPRYGVRVAELAGLDAAATHRLWTFLLDLDLTQSVESPMLPADDPLLSLLVDVRGATPRVADNLWVRLLDLPTALQGRRYASPLDVVVEVADAHLAANAGRWRLTTGERAADGTWELTVARTDQAPDLALDVRELGAVYLGGRSLEAYARAGLLSEVRPGAAREIAVAFAWTVAPGCSWVF
jgi:predicted acetyltransferase